MIDSSATFMPSVAAIKLHWAYCALKAYIWHEWHQKDSNNSEPDTFSDSIAYKSVESFVDQVIACNHWRQNQVLQTAALAESVIKVWEEYGANKQVRLTWESLRTLLSSRQDCGNTSSLARP